MTKKKQKTGGIPTTREVVNLLAILVPPGKAKKLSAKKKAKRLRGFAYMKLVNPDRLHRISTRAGALAQKKWGEQIRWSKQQAKKMAARGGLARWGRLLPRPEDAA
jgi:hypothetical protein